MRRFLPLLLLLLALPAVSQTNGIYSPRTDTFAFDKTLAITSWDGSNPTAPPYSDMGAVDLTSPGIEVPYELGYLNNGFLIPCDSIAWGQPVWTVGNGTNNGDTYNKTGATTCPYFTGEYGTYGNSSNILDGFSVTVTYVRTFRIVCTRGGCHKTFTDTLQGGTGTATQAEIN